MTTEKQRMAIADLIAWENQDYVCCIPDYLNDLNACHEFTAHMTYDQQVKFAEILHSIVLENPYRVWWNPTPHESFQMLDASAAQRCEAFLKVFDKWEETP